MVAARQLKQSAVTPIKEDVDEILDTSDIFSVSNSVQSPVEVDA